MEKGWLGYGGPAPDRRRSRHGEIEADQLRVGAIGVTPLRPDRFSPHGEHRGELAALRSVRFEQVGPVRSFGSYPGQRSFQGAWWFATTGELVPFESQLERDTVMMLDFDAEVVAVSAQPFWLVWSGQRGRRRHAPDLFARRVDGSAVVIDVGADDRIRAEDAEAFAATERACASVGWNRVAKTRKRRHAPGVRPAGGRSCS